MVDIATAAIIAAIASDTVGVFDKLYRGFVDVINKKRPTISNIPPPDLAYTNENSKNAFVAKSRKTGEIYQIVTYSQLCEKLSDGDLDYIKSLSDAMESYQRQWNSIFREIPRVGGIERARLEEQLNFLVKEISTILIKVLDFVQSMGMHLDDHYHMARNLAKNQVN